MSRIIVTSEGRWAEDVFWSDWTAAVADFVAMGGVVLDERGTAAVGAAVEGLL